MKKTEIEEIAKSLTEKQRSLLTFLDSQGKTPVAACDGRTLNALIRKGAAILLRGDENTKITADGRKILAA